MAYTVPSSRVIRPWTKSRRRYVTKSVSMLVGGSDDAGGTFSTGTANKTVSCPPGRIVACRYGIRTAAETLGNATSGALVTKAESTAGVQIFTDAALASASDSWKAVGTTAVDEGGAATAATDAFSGGFPIRGGIFSSISSGTDTERIFVQYLVRLCTYVRVTLTSTSGADGAGAVTYSLPLGGPGVLAALAIDYQNMPATTDIVIKSDDTNGQALFTRTDSNTDLAPSVLGAPGQDEAVNASAATDGTEAGNAFQNGLYITMAQADAFTSGDEQIILELWIDD